MDNEEVKKKAVAMWKQWRYVNVYNWLLPGTVVGGGLLLSCCCSVIQLCTHCSGINQKMVSTILFKLKWCFDMV